MRIEASTRLRATAGGSLLHWTAVLTPLMKSPRLWRLTQEGPNQGLAEPTLPSLNSVTTHFTRQCLLHSPVAVRLGYSSRTPGIFKIPTGDSPERNAGSPLRRARRDS